MSYDSITRCVTDNFRIEAALFHATYVNHQQAERTINIYCLRFYLW